MKDFIIDKLEEILPSGSGIDCKYQFEVLKNGKLKISNSWHAMNDFGYYIGYIDYSVIVDIWNIKDFRIVFHTNSNGRRFINGTMLDNYLYDTYNQVFIDNFYLGE